MSQEKLADFLKTGKDWARIRTSVPGVFVVKLPPYKSSLSRLVVELNPVDEMGTPMKRRGLVVRSTGEMEEFKVFFQSDKLAKLLELIEAVNPRVEAGRRRKDEEGVIEL